jgi:hypothetical protein
MLVAILLCSTSRRSRINAAMLGIGEVEDVADRRRSWGLLAGCDRNDVLRIYEEFAGGSKDFDIFR